MNILPAVQRSNFRIGRKTLIFKALRILAKIMARFETVCVRRFEKFRLIYKANASVRE